MGKIYSTLIRPIRTFNIENRAHKIISREKPIPAPQYDTTKKQRQLVDKINPNFLKDHYQKNIQLDQRLKNVYVTSADPPIKELPKESKALPQNRHTLENEFLYEYCETTMIPPGKCSLKQVFIFLLQHKRDPVKYNSEYIASEYKMDKKVVDDILHYFKLYSNMSLVDYSEEMADAFQEIIDESYMLKKKEKEKLDKI